MSKLTLLLKASGLLPLLFIAACGGGGSSSSNTDELPPASAPPPALPGPEVSGSGLLGIIVGGIVSIKDVGGSELAASVTDNSGNYGPVNLPSGFTGPVIVEISPAADGSSFFICDFAGGCPSPDDNSLIPFGDQVPYTATLSAVTPDESNVNSISVNPITSAIRARADVLGLTAANIIQADMEMATELTRLLGVEVPPNIASIPNVDLTNPTTDENLDPVVAAAAVNLSLLNAGLVSLISEDSDSSIDDVIDGFSDAFSNGGAFEASEEFNSGVVQTGELLFAMEQQITQLAEVQPEASEIIQSIAPENDLTVLANDVAATREEIAPVPPIISGEAEITATETILYNFAPSAIDPDGGTLSFTVLNLPTWASFDSVTGTISGTPDKDSLGSTSDITITVSDGTSETVLTPFNIEVIHFMPSLSGSPDLSVDEDDNYSFSPVSIVAPGYTITYTLTNAPDWLSQNPSTGALSGTPTNDDVGTDADITIGITDGLASATLTPFNLTVINVNDAPTLVGFPTASVLQDANYSFAPTAADIDSPELIFAVSGLPAWATFDSTTGLVSGIPGNSDVGSSNSINISVSDGIAITSLTPFTIDIVNVNDAPTISGDPITSIAQDASYQFTPSADDIDIGDSLTFSVQNLPSWATLLSDTGTISGTPDNGDVGIHTNLILSVSDGTLSTPLASFSITVTDVNDSPTISGTPPSQAAEDSGYSFQPQADDVDVGDSLTFSVVNAPSWLSINSSTGLLSGTPRNANVGLSPSITISVTDGEAVASLSPFNLNVINVNDPPSISGTPLTSATEDVLYSFSASASDVDVGDSLTFSLNNAPGWLGINTATGLVSGTPGNSNVGLSNNISVTVRDLSNVTASLGAFSITIANEPLVLSGTPDTTANEDSAYSFTPTATDLADVQSFSIQNQPSWTAFNTSTGQLSGTPTNDDVGTDSTITISATDGNATSSLSTFSITTFNTNDAPVISGAPANAIVKDLAFSFTPTVVDVDNPGSPDPLTFSIAGQPAWSTVAFDTNSGQLSGTPDGTELGPYNNIMITVDDGMATDVLTFSITVVEGEQILVSWTAPLTRENGNAITTNDLLGYELQYFEISVPGTITTVSTGVLDKDATSYTTPFLSIGTWRFAIKAIELTGFDGDLSAEVPTVVDGVPG